MNKTDVSLASQFCGGCHLRYNCGNITEYICLSNDFCKYIKDFRPLRKKETMELVWHNCKTCPPSEKHNENLLLWDGYTIINAEWDNGSWFCGKHYLDTVGEEEMCWWADLTQTVDAFFKKPKEDDARC